MGNTQSKVYVQNEHKALMEKIEKLDKTPEDALLFKHREQMKDLLFNVDLHFLQRKMEREFEAENYWSILPKI